MGVETIVIVALACLNVPYCVINGIFFFLQWSTRRPVAVAGLVL